MRQWMSRTAMVGVVALAAVALSFTASGSATSNTSLLPCTAQDEPTNFTTYSVGLRFEGLPLTLVDRLCTEPNPQSGAPRARINVVNYLYGMCELSAEVPRCQPPLAVQVWPRCERDPGHYTIDHHNPLEAKLTIRGVPAHLYEGGHRLEVYTGDSTVVVFGAEHDQVKRAATALGKAPARPTELPTGGDASRDLPPPTPAASDCSFE